MMPTTFIEEVDEQSTQQHPQQTIEEQTIKEQTVCLEDQKVMMLVQRDAALMILNKMLKHFVLLL